MVPLLANFPRNTKTFYVTSESHLTHSRGWSLRQLPPLPKRSIARNIRVFYGGFCPHAKPAKGASFSAGDDLRSSVCTRPKLLQIPRTHLPADRSRGLSTLPSVIYG